MKNIIYAVLTLYFSLLINVQAKESDHKNTFSKMSIKTSKGTRITKKNNYFKTIQNKELNGLNEQNVAINRRGNRTDYNGVILGRADQINETLKSNTRSR